MKTIKVVVSVLVVALSVCFSVKADYCPGLLGGYFDGTSSAWWN